MKFYNGWCNKEIELYEGEEVCVECDGVGMKLIFEDDLWSYIGRKMCNKCLGDGKFDWIEKIMGKPPRSYSTTSSGGVSSRSWSSSSYSENKKKFDNIKLLRKANERLIKRGRDPVSEVPRIRGRAGRFPFTRSNL